MLARRSTQADEVAEAEAVAQVNTPKVQSPAPGKQQQQQPRQGEEQGESDHHHRRHHHQWDTPHTGILSEQDVLNQMRSRSRSTSATRQGGKGEGNGGEGNGGERSTDEVRERQAEDGRRVNALGE
ncbi:hypothetical protein QBC40DRAFT_260804 [Triangularia verruculosa]|uniref:Uncharacterized protein n=1 Tax=Triangularia verruculosa TaxID=2587418 RepID=A0AAN7AZQ4_9PEZI|nr:hypothetical protein QBC40DRAFT_260804 [Triangularia verruculosa]